MSARSGWFGYGGSGTPAGDAGLLILRVVAMTLLITGHGLAKMPPSEQLIGWVGGMGFPVPVLFAWLAAVTEVVFAGLVLVGLFTRPLGFWLFGYLVIVALVPHAGDPLRDRELPILFATIGLALGLIGPGRYSIDGMRKG